MTRFIATWFYSGLLRPAPGTWGSLASLPFIYLTLIWSWGVWHLIVISIFIFLLGWWSTHNETKDKEDHDPSDPKLVQFEVIADMPGSSIMAGGKRVRFDLCFLINGSFREKSAPISF